MKKPVLFIIMIITISSLILYHLFSQRQYHDADFKITTYHSTLDKDGDGIDDQQDIINNVKIYIQKKPKYKSKYYQTGYPNDNYGVCTDLVAYALLHSGYDLQTLVAADIKANPNAYAITKPDNRIDFRRVRNLNVYFKHTAISLTTNIQDIKEWQAGDIVVFNNHIGIIADVRNSKGIPFVYHHQGVRSAYLEDILASRSDIIGHFRIS